MISMSSQAAPGHVPVMLNEVMESLAPVDGGIYVDGTFGGGGYSRAVLAAAACSVWAIDRDPAAVSHGSAMAASFGGRLTVLLGCFGDMLGLLNRAGVTEVDGVMLDLGVSSMQINDASRGFSFRDDGPLDMRMGGDGESAADLVNRLPERELADLIHRFGEERASRRIARAIVAYRAHTPISNTAQLADIIRQVVRRAKDGIDPATRTFQALRIQVNDELGEIERGLAAAEGLLKPGGRLVVVSFHSLEDGRVKAFLRDRAGEGPRPHRHMPDMAIRPKAAFAPITRRPLRPSREEIAINPRARSARLRAAERLAA